MLSVGIIGLGTIGSVVAKALDSGVAGMTLVAVASGSRDKAMANLANLSSPVDLMTIDEVSKRCEIVVDCAPKSVFRDIAVAAFARGRTLVTVSGAGILANADIEEMARQNGGQLVLATGALLGLDAVRAAAEGTINSVKMITRKPPNALHDAPYIIDNQIVAMQVFSGGQRGAIAFPANVNVAAALGLAGVGADSTELEVWADPHPIAILIRSGLTPTVPNSV